MLSCKQATELMSQAQDRPLRLAERLSLRVHLWMCAGCTHFGRHLEVLRAACRRMGGQ